MMCARDDLKFPMPLVRMTLVLLCEYRERFPCICKGATVLNQLVENVALSEDLCASSPGAGKSKLSFPWPPI